MKQRDFFVFVLCFFSLAFPVFLRALSGGFFVGESYRYLKLAQVGSGFYPLLLSFLVGNGVSLRAVQLSLGLLSFCLFYLLVRRISPECRIFSCFVLALSPLFVYTFAVVSPFSLAVPLVLLFFCLLQFSLFALLLLVPLFLVSVPSVVFVLFVVLSAFLAGKKERLLFVSIHLVALAVFMAFIFLSKQIVLSVPVSDFGAFVGFGIFDVVLASVGFVVLWKNTKFLAFYSALFVLVLAQVAGFDALPYLLFVSAFFAGHGFYWLYKRGWQLDLVKQLTLILIVCGLVFSGVSYATRLSSAMPDSSLAASLGWLKENSSSSSVVLSHETNRYFVGYFANRSFTVANSTVFYSRNLEATRHALDRYSVGYIFITPEMKQGLVWSRKDEGLLFLFRNQEMFQKVYDKEGIEIWRVLSVP